MDAHADQKYLEIILRRIQISRTYRPAFGQGHRVTWQEFQQLYGNDPFYSWFGLNDPLIYSAHRIAGGLTSIYRQIGLGCIDSDIVDRYEQAKWLILQGYPQGRTTDSTYTFLRTVIGYDLAAFFERHAGHLRDAITQILHLLLVLEDGYD